MAAPTEKSESRKFSLDDAHFETLNIAKGHPNVYGLSKLCCTSALDNRLLVASIQGGMTAIEWKTENVDESCFEARELHFTYIPGDAKIVSIDSFNKSNSVNGIVIGITFVKCSSELDRSGSEERAQFLNIYSDWKQEKTEFDLSSIAEGCVNLKLDFVPFQLTHTQLVTDSGKEYVFLLSGSDHLVHMYKEDKIFDYHTFIEQPADHYFPEFLDIPSRGVMKREAKSGDLFTPQTDIIDQHGYNETRILWLDIMHLNEDRQRLTAYGCQDGSLRIALVDVKEKVVLQSWSQSHDGPVTSVQLFTTRCRLDQQTKNLVDLLPDEENADEEPPEEEGDPEVHLLVTGALEVSVVYRDVLIHGFGYQTILAGSNQADAVLCACVADVDFDGENELMIGTYGEKLMVYKFSEPDVPSSPSSRKSSASSRKSSDGTKSENQRKNSPSFTKKRWFGHYDLVWEMNFSVPLFAIEYVDLTQNGVQELIVLSHRGVHIMKHSTDKIQALVRTRLRRSSSLPSEQDAFTQLQEEILDDQPS